MINVLNKIVNQQDVPQTPWKSANDMVQGRDVLHAQGDSGPGYIANVLNEQKVPNVQWQSGDTEDEDEEKGFWIKGNDLDRL
jgi:hypothetical protein